MPTEREAIDMHIELLIGPPISGGSEFTDRQLERGWRAFGGKLTESLRDHPRPGLRPWGYWRFTVNRPELSDDENYAEGVGVLAERGDLTEGERLKIAEGAELARQWLANPPHPHGGEESARQSIEAHEAVERAMGES